MARFKTVGLFLGLWLLAAATALAGSDYSLTILHTNDIHGHVLPFDYDGLPVLRLTTRPWERAKSISSAHSMNCFCVHPDGSFAPLNQPS